MGGADWGSEKGGAGQDTEKERGDQRVVMGVGAYCNSEKGRAK